ncbi:hypothetical protein LSTR_LSTR014604 [Laodelphax striatellus]|uniref:Uncharacterized protein n=1 Tax=Laodelphax striatellus TaxID=195883 RepID=A0A482XRA7_LAOST|nr:hypothetical protein LSTR_LSTR014604 [Laodelphax striatellus]
MPPKNTRSVVAAVDKKSTTDEEDNNSSQQDKPGLGGVIANELSAALLIVTYTAALHVASQLTVHHFRNSRWGIKSAGHSSTRCAADFSYGPTLPKLFNFYQGWACTLSDSIAESSVVVAFSACTVFPASLRSAITLKPVPTDSWRLISVTLGRARVHPGKAS